MTVVAYVPMKMNNERFPGKNTMLLGGSVPLYHLILRTLLRVESIDQVFVFCSEDSLSDLPEGVTYLRRDPELDTPTTRINEVMAAFQSAVVADAYVLAHATAPFISDKTIDEMVTRVVSDGFDSAVAVSPLQEFIWRGGAPLNYDPHDIPRTQDLEPFWTETTGAYVYRSDVGAQGRRVGEAPALVPVPTIEAIDINEPIDWTVADALFRHHFDGDSSRVGKA